MASTVVAPSREAARAHYDELSLPTTSDEHWRFTSLKGFDPDSFDMAAVGSGARPDAMLDVDAAGTAFVSESGIEIVDMPEGITFEPLGEHELIGQLVDADDKFTAHNAAEWQHGLLVRIPRGMQLATRT